MLRAVQRPSNDSGMKRLTSLLDISVVDLVSISRAAFLTSGIVLSFVRLCVDLALEGLVDRHTRFGFDLSLLPCSINLYTFASMQLLM